MPSHKMYPVRISDRARQNIKATAKRIGLFASETVRQAIDLGLPEVEKKFGRKKK
jgi:predicted DNA-binding protein